MGDRPRFSFLAARYLNPFNLPHGSWKVLTWGGLRGGISVALALSLPAGPERKILVALAYSVVELSILVQGLSMGRVARKRESVADR